MYKTQEANITIDGKIAYTSQYTWIQNATIRDNILLAEGDYLNSTKIKKSVDNIKSKQYFSKVDFKIEDSDKKNFKDFNLFVKEQPTGNISAGVGYGTNGGLFEASVNESNFLGKQQE